MSSPPAAEPALPEPASPAPAAPSPAGEELHCPMCRYDLRGLGDHGAARCPECGYRFTWEELRSPRFRVHDYLFEHHPERNVWSFAQTFLHGLGPRRFWRGLFPTQPSNGGRLIVYAVVVSLLVALPAAGHLAHGMIVSGSPFDLGIIARRLRTGELRPIAFVTALLLLWPWLTFAALMIFQVSMLRANVRPVHALRCVVYSADVALLGAASMAGFVVIDVAGPRIFARNDSYEMAGTVCFAVALMLTFKLWMAYRHYMRFDHALATVLATQVMLFIFGLKFALELNVLR